MKHVGLGFRKNIADETLNLRGADKPAFVEVAPENWIGLGGYWGKKFREVSEQYQITTHGLSLSIGSPDPLNWGFIKKIKDFIKTHDIKIYSEHLSYSQSENAHLYDLLPIPFREDAIKHIVQRIKEVQDFLEIPIVLENVSYYTSVAAEMDEATFIKSIVEESGCQLLLDINNVFVNAFNHNYDAKKFIDSLPLDSVAYMHMAGHEKVEEDLIIDTHGMPIIEDVFELYDWTLPKIKPVPVLLERDFNFPEMEEIKDEMRTLENIASKQWRNESIKSKLYA
ncbi:HvfB family MNIO-type RiPP peptide maturase [Brumimicrobium aurantiacum]|uniref:DUF692 domain-containing protein n=1 Tax=Brumimicrobium aurantiacum TaxID=1737063 RepID=A0A3E1EYG7_9FLAO|nr:DUF692 domain-containing protein [Brumimicrobium aurantiacum]RFC54592.1 DUF692 domain-containing protein [Brumimicrobium aurantiacum]